MVAITTGPVIVNPDTNTGGLHTHQFLTLLPGENYTPGNTAGFGRTGTPFTGVGLSTYGAAGVSLRAVLTSVRLGEPDPAGAAPPSLRRPMAGYVSSGRRPKTVERPGPIANSESRARSTASTAFGCFWISTFHTAHWNCPWSMWAI